MGGVGVEIAGDGDGVDLTPRSAVPRPSTLSLSLSLCLAGLLDAWLAASIWMWMQGIGMGTNSMSYQRHQLHETLIPTGALFRQTSVLPSSVSLL